MRSARLATAALLALAGCGLVNEPEGHGPQWVERSAEALVKKLGQPDKQVHLPPPSLIVVYIYGLGAAPGYSLCERDYYVRGPTVVGYAEHGIDPNCHRVGGHRE
ncbi:MAG TPA: hypothetical protein VMB84_12570 [Stellaceae bacterium]|nr:hypothetical protein [Stellaceae bacterium]